MVAFVTLNLCFLEGRATLLVVVKILMLLHWFCGSKATLNGRRCTTGHKDGCSPEAMLCWHKLSPNLLDVSVWPYHGHAPSRNIQKRRGMILSNCLSSLCTVSQAVMFRCTGGHVWHRAGTSIHQTLPGKCWAIEYCGGNTAVMEICLPLICGLTKLVKRVLTSLKEMWARHKGSLI